MQVALAATSDGKADAIQTVDQWQPTPNRRCARNRTLGSSFPWARTCIFILAQQQVLPIHTFAESYIVKIRF